MGGLGHAGRCHEAHANDPALAWYPGPPVVACCLLAPTDHPQGHLLAYLHRLPMRPHQPVCHVCGCPEGQRC
eukprot:2607638-Alexandrium_andersonii.AAC.1